jgi:hypothetical protein
MNITNAVKCAAAAAGVALVGLVVCQAGRKAGQVLKDTAELGICAKHVESQFEEIIQISREHNNALQWQPAARLALNTVWSTATSHLKQDRKFRAVQTAIFGRFQQRLDALTIKDHTAE